MRSYRKGSRQSHGGAPRKSYKPCIDLLEDRVTPSSLLDGLSGIGITIGGDPLPPIPGPINPGGSSGVISVSTQQLSLTSGGAAGTFNIVLNTQPTAEVDVTLAELDAGNIVASSGSTVAGSSNLLTITPQHLAFTTSDWNTAQTVSVSAVNGDSAPWLAAAVIIGTTSSADPNFDAQAVPPVFVCVSAPVQTGGVTVSTNALTVQAGGPSVTYTIALTGQPTADVNIAISQDSYPGGPSYGDGDAGAAMGWQDPTSNDVLNVSPTNLTFTSDNWSTPQTVTVSAPAGADSNALNWLENVFLNDTITSADPNYNGLQVPPVQVSIQANSAGLVFSKSTLDVVPGGAGDSYSVALASQPTDDVTVTIAQQNLMMDPVNANGFIGIGGDNPVAGTTLTITPTTLTFTPQNWNTAQTVNVSAPAPTTGSSGGFTLLTHTVTSNDANYNNLSVQPIGVKIEAVAVPGVVISSTDLNVTRGGDGDSFSIALATQPVDTVTIIIAQQGGDPLQLSDTPLTFTTSDWNTPQTVDVGPPSSGSGNQTDTLNLTASSANDANYSNLSLPTITVAVTDPNVAQPGVVFSTQTLTITPGSSATFTVALATAPTADVTVSIAQGIFPGMGNAIGAPLGPLPPVSVGGNLTVTPATLTFDATNWNTPQTVTVAVSADATVGMVLPVEFLATTVASSDPNYNKLFVPPIVVTSGLTALPPETPPGGTPPVGNDPNSTVSIANSTIRFASPSVIAGKIDQLTLVVKDDAGHAVSGLPNNAFSFNLAGGSSAGTIGSVIETATKGIYTAAFTGTTPGAASTLTTTVNGVALARQPAVTVKTGAVSSTQSSVSFSAPSVASGNTDTLTIMVVDAAGNPISGLPARAFHLGLKGVSAGTFTSVTETATPGTYTATFTATTAGTPSTVTARVHGVALAARPTIAVTPGAVSATRSTVHLAHKVIASGKTDTVTITVKDAVGNAVSGLTSGDFAFGLSGGGAAGTFGSVTETARKGTYTALFTGTTAGSASALTTTIDGVTLSAQPTIAVTSGVVSGANSTIALAAASIASRTTDTLTIVVADASGNAIGGLSSGAFHFALSGGTSTGSFGRVTATATKGTYKVKFTGIKAGTASIITASVEGVILATTSSVTVT
jgi:hypothetical protein